MVYRSWPNRYGFATPHHDCNRRQRCTIRDVSDNPRPEVRNVPHASRRDWELALGRLYYPISLPAVQQKTGPGELGGIDREVLSVLSRLPRESFDSQEELVQAIREVYVADGFPEDSLPI
jgi:hypothetical protein